MANNENNTLLFMSEESIKTLIDALLSAYGTADLQARSMHSGFSQKCAEVEELKKKLEAAEARIAVLDAAYADLDDERSAWKDKYDKLVENMNKKFEREGK